MKQHKRLLSLALAGVLALSLAAPAFAATGADGHEHKDALTNGTATATPDGYCDVCGTPHDINGYNDQYEYVGNNDVTGVPDTDLDTGAEATYKDESGRTVPFIGVIKPTRIKATIPTQVVFDLDPTINVTEGYTATGAADSAKVAQVTQPTPGNLKVTNNSTVPMYVYVANVTTKNATLTQAVADVKDKDKNVMFALTPEAPAQADALTTANDWMKPVNGTVDSTVYRDKDAKTHYLLNVKPADSGTATGTGGFDAVAPAADLELYINAVSLKGWTADETFTVMPTIVVSVHNPDVAVTYKAQEVTPGADVVPAAVDAPDIDVSNPAQAKITQAAATAIYYSIDGGAEATTGTGDTFDATTGLAAGKHVLTAYAVKDGLKSPVVSAGFTTTGP